MCARDGLARLRDSRSLADKQRSDKVVTWTNKVGRSRRLQLLASPRLPAGKKLRRTDSIGRSRPNAVLNIAASAGSSAAFSSWTPQTGRSQSPLCRDARSGAASQLNNLAHHRQQKRLRIFMSAQSSSCRGNRRLEDGRACPLVGVVSRHSCGRSQPGGPRTRPSIRLPAAAKSQVPGLLVP
jgi:hypothetical protein